MSAAPLGLDVRVTSTRYGQAALDALRAAVARAKRHDPMAPVTVIVPNNIAGIVARRHLARGITDEGNGIVGIWFTTLARLAEQIAAPLLTADGRRPASRAFTAGAIRRALHEQPGLFEPVRDHPSTVRALATAHAALRNVDTEHVDRVREVTPLAADIVRVHPEAALSAAGHDVSGHSLPPVVTHAGEVGRSTMGLGRDVIRSDAMR